MSKEQSVDDPADSVEAMEIDSDPPQNSDDKDLYTDSGNPGSSDQTHSLDSQRNEQDPHAQLMLTNQFPNGLSSSDPVVTTQPTSYTSKTRPDHSDIYTAPGDQIHSSDLQRNEDLPSSNQFPNGQDSQMGRAGSRDSGPTQDDKQNPKIKKDQTQPNEVNDEKPQPSAPLDVAKCIIKVGWTEPFPDKWGTTLEKVLQSWLNKQEGKPSAHNLKLLEDPHYAEVQITPSTALEVLKQHSPTSLKFKDKDGKSKEVTAWICLDEAGSVTDPQKSMLKEDEDPSTMMFHSSMSVAAASEDRNNVEDVAASNKSPNKSEATNTDAMTPETPAAFTLPLAFSLYMNHAFGKEVKQIEHLHGVSICAEVSVSIKPTDGSSPDSVSKASADFHTLVQGCLDSFSDAVINHNQLDSDIVKEAVRAIQSEETKMMFTMSSSNCQFFGPKKFTDTIKRGVEGTAMESQTSLDMDTKDLPTQLKMDEVHWDLMKLSYENQLSRLETKYGVSFHEEKLKDLTIKVCARSKGVQHVNLETHAIRALTQLYQKLASAAVTCELKNPADATLVRSTVEKHQHCCVVAGDALSGWRLVGLPEHLGPAITDIEKTPQKSVFDKELKKLIGYSGDIPHARGVKLSQMPDYGLGAVGGSVWDEGGKFRRRSEADPGLNEESKDASRNESKGTNAEEETCVICMDSFTDKKKLKCGHEFCRDCISESEKSLGSICPVCKEVYGKLEGNQPRGTMNVRKSMLNLPGYPNCGTIEIYYDIPDGVQTEKHPNPGKRYYGAQRQAYLPDNREGKEVLSLLQRAFNQKLIFTVGRSTTSGADNVVTWNDIHHKTSRSGGPERYGYPDPGYLNRVKDELKAKGIE